MVMDVAGLEVAETRDGGCDFEVILDPYSIPPAARGLILVGAETQLYFSSRRGYFLEGCDRRA